MIFCANDEFVSLFLCSKWDIDTNFHSRYRFVRNNNDVLKKLNGEGQVSDHYGIYGRGESRQTIADLALTEPVEDVLGK